MQERPKNAHYGANKAGLRGMPCTDLKRKGMEEVSSPFKNGLHLLLYVIYYKSKEKS